MYTVKKESSPATHHGGTWWERRYSSYSFFSLALEEGEWSAHTPTVLYTPGKGQPIPTAEETVWVPKPVWMQKMEEKSSASVGD
jgi:hypothetical protein